jgi:thiamine biosynthesis lipoprotein
MTLVRLARYAMATRFELALYGERESFLRAAGEEALDEIERLEAQLSLYRANSDVSDLNRRAAHEAVPVDPRLFALLVRARQLSEETEGAFDITIAPLMRCWGFVGGSGQMPTEEAIAEARERVGMRHVLLDESRCTVRFDREGVSLDFGAIGKGYAIERATDLLRENGIPRALLHGGTSTVYAIGAPPDAEGWTVAIQRPFAAEADAPLAQIVLRDAALSVSAPHGKWFETAGRRYGHVIDPYTGYPASRSLLAALVLPSATDSDALSTALLTRGVEGLPALLAAHPDARYLLAVEEETGDLRLTSNLADAVGRGV